MVIEKKDVIGMSDAQIEALLKNTTDELQRTMLTFRHVCNESLRKVAADIIEPIFGGITHFGQMWAKKIGEEKLLEIYAEQESFFEQFPSEKVLAGKLSEILGVDCTYNVEKRADAYIVYMYDKCTEDNLQFNICLRGVFFFKGSDSNWQVIVQKETDQIMQFIYEDSITAQTIQ